MNPKKNTQEKPELKVEKNKKPVINWTTLLSWGGTALLVAGMVLVLLKVNPLKNASTEPQQVGTPVPTDVKLPLFQDGGVQYALVRSANMDTVVPEGQRQFPIKYTIEEGDSIFAIAKRFDLKPGWQLTIPPTDGIYYKWKEGDTLVKVADKYRAEVDNIISWPSNKLDISNPVETNIEYVMIPGGYREVQPWIIPIPYTPRSGATRVIAGPGGCAAVSNGVVGSTAFVWPTNNRYLSGFDFSSYHLAIDIGAEVGTPVYSSDSGTVIYSGWNDTGYGNLIVIDHNNGYETVYAHLSNLYVSCGQNVIRGGTIAAAGNTGKSTGAHLHFEIRLNGSFINPWSVLP